MQGRERDSDRLARECGANEKRKTIIKAPMIGTVTMTVTVRETVTVAACRLLQLDNN